MVEWRDIMNLAGFAITIASLWLAIFQIRKTATVAEAARKAAERMLSQNRDQFRQYVAANLRRFLSELRMFVDGQCWDRAAMRFDDLAEQLSQMALVSDGLNAGMYADVATAARQWSVACRRTSAGKSRFVRSKFDNYLRRLHGAIDSVCGPFAGNKENQP